jgi:ribosomal protein S18 acetylase RimI-like enzyme
VVGELTGLTDSEATIEGRRGPVVVPLAAIVIARPVAADRRQILDLEVIAGRGWRAREIAEFDGWLLRADRGWTGRANSVLPAGTPSRPLAAMLDAARSFYTQRNLPLQIQLPLPARGPLAAELAQRGWPVQRPAVVLTRKLERTDPAWPVALTSQPSGSWLAAYHYRGGVLPDHAVELLVRHDQVRFATATVEGQVAGIARGAVDDGWLGITAVEVGPEQRRRGVAVAMIASLQSWASTLPADHCYVQVDVDNQPALALYRRLGFTEHHRYHYRTDPEVG